MRRLGLSRGSSSVDPGSLPRPDRSGKVCGGDCGRPRGVTDPLRMRLHLHPHRGDGDSGRHPVAPSPGADGQIPRAARPGHRIAPGTGPVLCKVRPPSRRCEADELRRLRELAPQSELRRQVCFASSAVPKITGAVRMQSIPATEFCASTAGCQYATLV